MMEFVDQRLCMNTSVVQNDVINEITNVLLTYIILCWVHVSVK